METSYNRSRNMKDQSCSDVWLKNLIEDKINLLDSLNTYLNLK